MLAVLIGVGFAFVAPAGRLPAGRRPGLHHHRRADAAGGFVQPHARSREARRGISDEASGRRHRDVPHRLQLPRPGPEHRAGLRHAEGLVGARRQRFRRADRRRHQPQLRVVPRRQGHRAAAAADRQSRQFERLQLPPAGPRPARLSRADARQGPAARGGSQEPGAAGGLCRRPAARAAGRAHDRPREGRGARRHVRGHQQHDLDQSRLGLHQRLPQPRTHAARDRAGRPRRAHAGRRDPDLQRPQQPRPARAAVVVRDRATGRSAPRRSSASTTIRRCASPARPSPATPAATRSARWSGWPAQLPRGFGYEWTGQSLQEKLSGSQAPFLLALSALLVFLVLAALYESWTIPLAVLLTVPLGMLGAVVGGNAARAAERRLFHRRPRHHHRARGQGRHPDHRVRQGAARAGQVAHRSDDRGLPACASGRS